MPHFVVEYTANLGAAAEIPVLLRRGIEVLTAEGYPLAGMRARGHRIDEYVLADGARDYVMVHGILKVAPGHPVEKKQRTCEVIFELMKAHFARTFTNRYFMLSVEIVEIVSGNGPTLKYSNVREAMDGGPPFKTAAGDSL
jgi:5-carboxymethyl-2-hydroxymuconate isomerase